MPRWEPHARERLEAAALDLFEAQGYESTTVADLAGRAAVTPRTFFRHFADKREVLFGNAEQIHTCITGALGDVSSDVSAVDACVEALRACEQLFPRRGHDFLRRRAAVIASSEELRDREDRKLRAISAGIASALRRRGQDARDAALVADYGTFVLLVQASDLWMHDPGISFSSAVDRSHRRASALIDPGAATRSRGGD